MTRNQTIYLVLGIVVLAVLAGSAIYFIDREPGPGENNVPVSPTPNTPQPQPNGETYKPEDGKIEPVLPLEQQADWIVEITTAGFSPAMLEIKKGDSIIWTSRDSSAAHEIISTDPRYPERAGCGTKIDSCFALKLGESFRATLNAEGTWNYADKNNPNFRGRIVVK